VPLAAVLQELAVLRNQPASAGARGGDEYPVGGITLKLTGQPAALKSNFGTQRCQ